MPAIEIAPQLQSVLEGLGEETLPMTQSFHQARAEIEQLVERFAHNLDAYKRVDYKEAHAAFAGCITHVHVKDSHWMGDTYERTDLGKGDVDIEWVVRALEADGYTGDYALEFEIERSIPVEVGFPAWLDYFIAID